LGGRLTGTKGEILATNYVALHFETLGLLPAGDNETYFQEFEFTSGVSAGPENTLTVGDQALTLETDWRPVAFSTSMKVDPSDVIFAGYGLKAPSAEGIEEYDSFVHLDVKDKWVVVFRFMPENFTPEQRTDYNLDYLLTRGELFTLIPYGQLICEQAALTGLPHDTLDQIFDVLVRDFSAYAAELHGKTSATEGQQAWAKQAITKPVVDQDRFDSVWEKTRALAGGYEMRP
jgi:hypothetical protein